MDLGDFFGARWLSIEIPYEHFDVLRIRCRTCYQRLRDTGDYDVLTADREELIRLGARVVYFGLAEGEECLRWNLLLPLSAVNLERVAWHLFHELECEWDRKFIGSKPVGVDDLAEGRIKPLPLPLSGTLPRTLG